MKSVKDERSLKAETDLKTPNYVHCLKSTCQIAAHMAKKRCYSSKAVTMGTAQLDFLRQAEICRQGPKEQFDTCRSFLHDGRIKVPKIHPWPLPYYMYYNKQNMVSEVTIDNEHIKLC